jgi:hypothetical protein
MFGYKIFIRKDVIPYDEKDLPLRPGKPHVPGGTRPAVLLPETVQRISLFPRRGPEITPCIVRGTVIDDDDLEPIRRKCLPLVQQKAFPQSVFPVIRRYDHGNVRGGHRYRAPVAEATSR